MWLCAAFIDKIKRRNNIGFYEHQNKKFCESTRYKFFVIQHQYEKLTVVTRKMNQASYSEFIPILTEK